MRFGVVALRDPSRRFEGRLEIDRRREIARAQSPLERRPELVERVAHRIAGRLPETAVAGSLHELNKTFEVVDLIARPATLGDLVHDIALYGRADPARGAEAAALVGEEVGEISRHLEDVPVMTEDHEGARRGNVLEGDPAAELVGRQEHARSAADLNRCDGLRAAVF